jgi:REP element-mobilizing transposase RayT
MSLKDDPHREQLRAAGWHTRGYLPHFDGQTIPQFITLHLADAVPLKVLERWQQELGDLKEEKDRILYRRRIERYLDQGYGSCHLRESAIAKIVQDNLLYFEGDRYKLSSWIVMPNHTHSLLTRFEGFDLSQIMHSQKSYTAHEANKALGRTGAFWMEEYFDRYIRNEKHFWNTVRYIENNPVKAGLCERPEDWPFSSAWFRKRGLKPFEK